jgi:hypothetical protein
MSDVIDLSLLSAMLKRVQTNVTTISVKLDLLSKGREHDKEDIVGIISEKIADFDLRITSAVAQVTEALADINKLLNERLPPKA